jgi:hypothetical protein
VYKKVYVFGVKKFVSFGQIWLETNFIIEDILGEFFRTATLTNQKCNEEYNQRSQ